jgi:hypothetical protein
MQYTTNKKTGGGQFVDFSPVFRLVAPKEYNVMSNVKRQTTDVKDSHLWSHFSQEKDKSLLP